MKTMAKTAKQVLQEQAQQAAQDRATGVVPTTRDDGWHDAAQDADMRLSRGVRLKFKDGRFYDENGAELPDGVTAIALGLRHAWVRWSDHRPVEIIERKPGVPLPARETLGYSARDQWEIGPSGAPTDPWVSTRFLYLIGKSGAVYTFTTSSMGGSGAIEKLADAIDFMRRVRPGAVPEIELRSAPMKTRYGVRTKPDFPIVGWRGGDDTLLAKQLPAPSTEELLSDEIPF
jgi:hypothetical protein